MQVPLNGHSRKLRVGVLFGGRSGEHEGSLASAASIIRGLDPQKYEAVPIGITKEGHWLIGEGAQKMLPEVLRTGQRVVMSADPTESSLMPIDGSARGQKLDVVFPVIHGTFGEDGTMQGLLELAGLPFVGAGVLGSAIGMDKDVAKKLMQVAGIPVVPWIAVQRADWERQPKEIRRAIEKKFKYPVFVKPATLGSSVGMTKVHSRAELGPALDLAAEFAMKIMVERAVSARALELSGMARVDFFIEKRGGKIFLNEVNTIPGFTSISMYPKLWEANGIPFRELVTKLIDLALEQHREKARTKYQIELPEGASGALGG